MTTESLTDAPYHFLYRHFDAQDRLLYVGISLSAIGRLCQHQQTAGWFSMIARMTVEPYPTRHAALKAERDAILAEGPLYNVKRPGARVQDKTLSDFPALSLTLNEHRLLIACMVQMHQSMGLPPSCSFNLSADFLAALFSLSLKNAYEEMATAVSRLATRSAFFPAIKQRERLAKTSVYNKGAGSADIVFTAPTMAYLFDLRGELNLLCLKRMAPLKSPNSIRIYQMLMQFGSTERLIIELDSFREWMQFDQAYRRFIDLKIHVIEPAVTELRSKSNLEITWQAHKKRRSVDRLEFRFREA